MPVPRVMHWQHAMQYNRWALQNFAALLMQDSLQFPLVLLLQLLLCLICLSTALAQHEKGHQEEPLGRRLARGAGIVSGELQCGLLDCSPGSVMLQASPISSYQSILVSWSDEQSLSCFPGLSTMEQKNNEGQKRISERNDADCQQSRVTTSLTLLLLTLLLPQLDETQC